MKSLTNVAQLLVSAKTINGVSYVGIRGYVNKQGEVSNQLLNVGVSYEKMMQNDFISLLTNKENVKNELAKKFDIALIEKGYNELYISLEKRLSKPEIKEKLRLENDSTIKRSDAQIDAYTHVATGVKVHNETGKINVFGFVERKTIIEAIVYENSEQKDLTKCKRAIEKFCKCKLVKYKTFDFNKGEIKIKGFTI